MNQKASDALLYRMIPHALGDLFSRYFRLEVAGAENLPRTGSGIITPNHSGYAGVDALMITYEIYKGTGRIPRVMTHYFWFLSRLTSNPMQKMGFVNATTTNGIYHLNKKNLILLFPEGEYGNFKPTSQAYNLQEFRRGFVRMAIKTQSPIIPTVVIGAEETFINLGQIKLEKWFKNFVLPLPLNLVPLPARWKIQFLPPIHLPYSPDAADDNDLVHEIASEIREDMQLAINKAVESRSTIYV